MAIEGRAMGCAGTCSMALVSAHWTNIDHSHGRIGCSLVTIKLILGINLLSYARRRSEGDAMERRMKEDEAINFYGRPPIGEGKREQVSILTIQAPAEFPRGFFPWRCSFNWRFLGYHARRKKK